MKLTKKSWQKAFHLFSYLKPYWLKFSVGLFILIVSSLITMLFPALAGQIVDTGSGADNSKSLFHFDDINSIALALFLVFLTQAVLGFFRVYLFNDVSERIMKKIRQQTYSHIIRLPMSFFDRKRVGELNSRISSDITQAQEMFTVILAEFVRQTIIIIVSIVALTYYSVHLTLTMLASLPVVIVIAVLMGKWVKKHSKRTQTLISDSNIIAEETFTAITSVKSFANELFEVTRYKGKTEDVRKAAMKSAIARGLLSSFIIAALFGAIVLVIWQAAKLLQTGEVTSGDLFSFILYTVFVGASIGGTADLFARIQKAVGATEDLFGILDEEIEPIQLEKETFISNDFNANIEFKNVGFAYPNRPDIQILKNVSFSAKEGESVALVGASGAGKSTIVSLLMRFYPPTSGQIEVNNKNIADYDLTEIRNRMAIVPQEVLLFGGSIRDNIAYGNPLATDEEIKEAARKANAFDFIEKFPEGFETLVGERGVQLSGGQRQRIAIARAVLKNPSILILDEATSALDSESEKLVQDALDELMQGRTSIVIAHRLSTIRKANKILVMQDGQIVESGSHNDLVNVDNGIYRNLSALQLEVN